MSVSRYTIECDSSYCDETSRDEFLSDEEAMESGWYFLRGPERDLGGKGERTYCSLQCLEVDAL